MELEIRLDDKHQYSFTVKSLEHVMDYPRNQEFMTQMRNVLTSTIEPPIWSEPQPQIESLDSLTIAYEPTGNAGVIIDFKKQAFVVRPDLNTYVHFPLYRHIADWKDYII
jgi:hypothetical protein